MFGEPALTSVAGLAFETVDEVDDVVKASAGTGADAAPGDGDGQMGLAGAGTADQHDVALLGDKAAGEIWLIGVPSNWKSAMSLARGSLAMVSWYLIGLACFSLISAVSKSPTMR